MKRLICSIIIGLLLQPGFSQSQYRFQHYGANEGLTHEALAITQDSSGFLWILHPMGISRFDGYEFKYYEYSPSDSLSASFSLSRNHHSASTLTVDTGGNVSYISESNKTVILSRYVLALDGFVKYSVPVDGDIFAVCFDKKAPIVWLSAYPTGLVSFNLETEETIKYINVGNDSLLDFRVGSPLEQRNTIFGISDQRQHLLLASWDGLWLFDKATHQFSRPSNSSTTSLLTRSNFLGLDEFPTMGDAIWLSEIISYKKIPNTYYGVIKASNDLSSAMEFDLTGVVGSIAQATDRSGIYWAASADRGLFRADMKKGTVINILHRPENPYSLPSNNLRDMLVDRDDNLWVVCENGIGKLQSNPVKVANFTVEGLLDPAILFHESGHEDLLLFSRSGLVTGNFDIHEFLTTRIRPGNLDSIEIQPLEQRFIGNEIATAWEGEETVWFGSKSGPVASFSLMPGTRLIQPGSLQGLDIQNSGSPTVRKNIIHSDHTTGVWEDDHGNLWVSTYGSGLNNVELKVPYGSDGSVIHYRHDSHDTSTISSDVVLGGFLREDTDAFWVTTAAGVDLFHDGRFEHLFSNEYTTALLRTSGTTFLIGAFDGLYEGAKIGERYRFTKLPFKYRVCAIQKDKRGRLWISDCEKLICYEPARGVTIEFGTAEGFDHIGSGLAMASHGTMALSNVGGITLFDPLSLHLDSTNKYPRLTRLQINNQPAPIESRVAFSREFSIPADIGVLDEIVLDYQHNNFSIEFSAMQMVAPERNRYRHMLENYDADWIETDWTNRTATYTNLNAGEYIFRVKTSNHQGIWSDKEKIMIVRILPPPWKTWWAYSLYGCLVAAGIYLAHRIQQSRLLQSEREKALNQQLVHADEIRIAYTELKSTQALLIQSEKMASLGELTAGIAHEIQNPLNFINNFSEVNGELLEELAEALEAERTSEVKDIAQSIRENESKITLHGRRADGIVKNMLQHSRASVGKKEPVDVNSLAEEYFRLAYHGLRAKDKSFNVAMKTEFDERVKPILAIQQDIGRVILNIVINAFHAVHEKKLQRQDGFEPTVLISTKNLGNKIEVRVSDNGNGIPEKSLDKIFQPFYTTKPTGQGTGLGLSLSYDIVKAHGGRLLVETKLGEGSVFIVELPTSLS